MKLYLSSVGVPNIQAYKNLFAAKQPRIGLVPNAWDVVSQKVSAPFINKTRQQLKKAGAVVENIDLKTANVAQRLKNLDGIWIMGGNTFYLAWAANQAGLAQALAQQGSNFVYGAESAGAVLAGQTLKGIEFLDDPAEAPQVLWDGLGLVSYGIIPHWNTPGDEAALQKCQQEMQKFTKVKTLTDQEFIVAQTLPPAPL